jgi:membrane protein DedA with SNARE-associated domain
MAIALSALYSVAMIPLGPMLIATHPLLLEAISGSNPSVVAAGAFSEVKHNLPTGLVIAAALPAMMRSDWVMWWAGRLWGHRFVEKLNQHSRRAGAAARLAERRGKRFAAPLVALSAFLPGGTQAPLYAAAGWLGLPLVPFLIADAIGTAVWVAVLTASGYLLGGTGVAMAGLASRYMVLVICLPAVTRIAPWVWRACRRRRRTANTSTRVVMESSGAAPSPDGQGLNIETAQH